MSRFIFACCVAAALAGCSSTRHIESQALDFDDADLRGIEHRLVMLTVHIEPARLGVKLRGVEITNTSTAEVFGYAFFNNVILRSSALPHIVADNVVQHMLFLDLPAGSYAMNDFEFAYLGEVGSSTVALRKRLTAPVRFDVGNSPTYLGRLRLGVSNPRATTVFGQQKGADGDNTVRVGLLDTADVDLTVSASNEAAEDVLKAQQRYKALTNQQFAIGSMSVGQ